MPRIARRTHALLSRGEGQAVIEYALVIAVLSIGMVVVLLGFGNHLVDAAREGASALIG
ncbi:MAG: hypothetical protein IH609_07455 [Dehalococcoidia bacterium]|nr:hypothetical protein [Dehalococcoidia bacterium]